MKKFFTLTLLVISMMFFVACGGSDKKTPAQTDASADTAEKDDNDADKTDSGENNGDEDTNENDDEEQSECTGLSVEWDSLDSNLTIPVEVGDPELKDYLYMEFYDEDGYSATPENGTYDLGEGKNANYSSCSECIVVRQDYIAPEDEESSGSFTKTYFQKSGTLTVEDSDREGNIKGTLNAKLIEVTISRENGYESTPVEGGGCIEIETAAFDSGVCVPECKEGWECGNDGCGGTCGTCDGKACSADRKCVEFKCGTFEVDDFELVEEDSIFGTYYYYDAYSTGDGIGSPSVPDLLEIGLYADTLEETTVTLSGDTNNIGQAYVALYEDWDAEEYSVAKTYFQESGTLKFNEVKAGTMESNGVGSFRVVEVDEDYIPTPGGKCYEFKNLAWETICVPKCEDDFVCGSDGCGGVCGEGCGALFCSEDQKSCVEEELTECIGFSLDLTKLVQYRKNVFYVTNDANDLLQMQFYQNTETGEISTGEYDLASSENIDFNTCTECVRFDSDEKTYFQHEGTLKITEVDSSNRIKGTISAKLAEAEIIGLGNNVFVTNFLANGFCFEIEAGTEFDTPVDED